ncbi:MAG: glycosyltransferase [bacterium]|nr:glycosyltransferase [bacterium]
MIVAVIAPTYNEQDNIGELITRVLDQQKFLDPNDQLHVVVSDSHSSDNTGQIVKEIEQRNPRVHYLDVVERGLGLGIIKGFEYGIDSLKADIVISLDADLSHPPSVIPPMVEKIKQGYDWVVGSRFVKGGKNELEFHRRFFSYMANSYARFMMGIYSLHEFTASYRALSAPMFKKIDLDAVPWRSKSFIIQPALAYELYTKKAKYFEVPIVFVDRRAGRSKINTALYIRELLLFALKIRLRKSKQFLKFVIVGSTGFIINTFGLIIFHKVFHLSESFSASLGAEIAIISNFLLNNYWTFKHIKTNNQGIWGRFVKFLKFNLSSFGAIAIQFVLLELGRRYITPNLPISDTLKREVYLVYYIFAVGLGLIYNYIMYSRVIWKKQKSEKIASEPVLT